MWINGLLDPDDRGSLAPEFIKPVVFTLLGGENMDDDCPDIQQNPA
jgi:hypothetical protein